MSDDEEVLPENSDLCNYLRNMGYSDVETMKNIPYKQPVKLYLDPQYQSDTGTIEQDTLEEVRILMSGKLIFEEDVVELDSIISNFKTVKTNMLRHMFQGKTAAILVFIGFCLYFFIGGFTFIVISIFYAHRASDYLWKKHYHQKKLRDLVHVLKESYLLLNKSIKFVNENNELLKLSKLDNHYDEINYFINFKKDVIKYEKKIINLLSKATNDIVKSLPLAETIEKAQFYLCNNINSDLLNAMNEGKLHQLYTLIQSEFVQRVILTIIPVLSKTKNTKMLYRVLREVTLDCEHVQSMLDDKYKFVFLNGVYHPRQIPQMRLQRSEKASGTDLSKELLSSIHDTSNKLQTLLIQTRDIENNLSRRDSIEEELVQIQRELQYCHGNIADSLIFLKKLHSSAPEPVPPSIKEEQQIEIKHQLTNHIQVGYTDLDPKVDDEVFEAEIIQEPLKGNLFDEFSIDDVVKRKKEKEYSKVVLKELKTRIVERAKDWESREAKIMQKKQGIVPKEEDGQVGGEEAEELPLLPAACEERVENCQGLGEEAKEIPLLHIACEERKENYQGHGEEAKELPSLPAACEGREENYQGLKEEAKELPSLPAACEGREENYQGHKEEAKELPSLPAACEGREENCRGCKREPKELPFLPTACESTWPLSHFKRCKVQRENGRIKSACIPRAETRETDKEDPCAEEESMLVRDALKRKETFDLRQFESCSDVSAENVFARQRLEVNALQMKNLLQSNTNNFTNNDEEVFSMSSDESE